jgi:ATP adenylyltransferase
MGEQMDTLWAPWRMQYLEAERRPDDECVFCRAASDTVHDQENLVLHRNETCYIVFNRYPYNTGHVLVVPYRHVGDLADLTEREANNLFQVTRYCVVVLRKALNPHAFNLGLNLGAAAGAGITDHVHMHVVPRWQGDTNFMPIVAKTKVISEMLSTTYEKVAKVAKATPFPAR